MMIESDNNVSDIRHFMPPFGGPDCVANSIRVIVLSLQECSGVETEIAPILLKSHQGMLAIFMADLL